jgi:hypothetical protein
MIQFLDIHRHPDGSIDFDFYRRRAGRRRRLALRLVLRHRLIAVGQAARAIISAIEKSIAQLLQAPREPSLTKHRSAAEVVRCPSTN